MKAKSNVPIFPSKSLNQQVGLALIHSLAYGASNECCLLVQQLIELAEYFKNELKGDIGVPDEDNQSEMILTIFSLVESSHLALKASQGRLK